MNNSVVVIPTYNEVDNIESLIRQILSLKERLDILVVDDSSPDGTGILLRKLAESVPELKLIHRQQKSGLGKAYLAAFKQVLENGYEYIVCMDGDFSHNPKYIPYFLEKIKNCDLVLGSRYLDGINVINWSFFRLFLSLTAAKYMKLVTGLPFSDLLGGFKCFRRKILQQIISDTFISKGYIFQVEAVYRAYKKGYHIEEIPIVFVDRGLGKSKLSLSIIFEALCKALILRLTI